MVRNRAKKSYRLSVNLFDFQGEYLEAKVKDGTFESINQAIRTAVDSMAGGLPVLEVGVKERTNHEQRTARASAI